jgi:hypothetical protein
MKTHWLLELIVWIKTRNSLLCVRSAYEKKRQFFSCFTASSTKIVAKQTFGVQLILVKAGEVKTTMDSPYIEKCDTIPQSRRNKQHGENKYYNAFPENVYESHNTKIDVKYVYTALTF